MCCIKLSAEAVLVNYFGSPLFQSSDNDTGMVNVSSIQSCAAFLANNLPGYVSYDISIKALQEAVKSGMFQMSADGSKIALQEDVDRQRYNWSFPSSIANRIEKIVDKFFQRELYKREIQPVAVLIA